MKKSRYKVEQIVYLLKFKNCNDFLEYHADEMYSWQLTELFF